MIDCTPYGITFPRVILDPNTAEPGGGSAEDGNPPICGAVYRPLPSPTASSTHRAGRNPKGSATTWCLSGQSIHHQQRPEAKTTRRKPLPLLKRSTRLRHTPTSRHRDVLASGISPGQKGLPHAPPLSFHLRWCSPNPGMICASYPNPAEGQDISLHSPP